MNRRHYFIDNTVSNEGYLRRVEASCFGPGSVKSVTFEILVMWFLKPTFKFVSVIMF